MKSDKWLRVIIRVIIMFLLVMQVALLLYFIAMAGHYVSLENTAGVIYNLFFVLLSILGIGVGIRTLIE